MSHPMLNSVKRRNGVCFDSRSAQQVYRRELELSHGAKVMKRLCIGFPPQPTG